MIYGTTSTGGSAGKGTVYSFNIVQALGTDQLGITQAGSQIVLYWPAWATNVTLQATSDPTNGVWVDFTNGTPIIGLVTTNSGSNTFFRLQPHSRVNRVRGVAPLLVKTIFEKIVEINSSHGITILLVEQNANLALEISHFGYVLEMGRITLQDQSVALRQNPQVKSAYLGG